MLDIQQVFDGTFAGTPAVPTGAAITVSRASTNVLNMLVPRDMGAGAVLGIHVQVMENFATLTSLTIEFQVSALEGSGYVTLLTSMPIPVAQLVVGSPIFRYGVPLNQVLNATAGVPAAPGQYMRLNYTVTGTTATAGSVFAYINPIEDRNQTYIYPENYVS